MIRTLIIEDEPVTRADNEQLLAQHPDFMLVGSGGSVAEGLVLIPATRPDLVLLDICLSDGTGFDLLGAFPGFSFRVIFITAYDEHALKAIRVGALDYLLKPLDEEELARALQKVKDASHAAGVLDERLQLARQTLQNQSLPGRIALRSSQYVELVALADILYCESDGGYTTFHTADRRKIVVSRPLKDYEQLLPPPRFIRTHQSYLVNLQHVHRYNKEGFLELGNGSQVPVSYRKREWVISQLTGDQ